MSRQLLEVDGRRLAGRRWVLDYDQLTGYWANARESRRVAQLRPGPAIEHDQAMDALTAAIKVKSVMVELFSAECDDPAAARVWYEANITVWGPDHVATYVPGRASRAEAAIALEGAPEGERGCDCWGVDISEDPAILDAIPGWYMECEACWLVSFYRSPDPELLASMADAALRRRRRRGED